MKSQYDNPAGIYNTIKTAIHELESISEKNNLNNIRQVVTRSKTYVDEIN